MNKQQRLNDTFGKSWTAASPEKPIARNLHFCFELFVQLIRFNYSQDQLIEIAKQYKLNINEEFDYTIPHQESYGRFFFPKGRLKNNGTKISGNTTATQKILSIDSYIMDDMDNDYGTAFEDLKIIARYYIPEIERQIPQLKFEHSRRADSGESDPDYFAKHGGFSLAFKYLVQPYYASFCHPNDLGKLKPITVIDGHIIEPKTPHINGVELHNVRKIQRLKP